MAFFDKLRNSMGVEDEELEDDDIAEEELEDDEEEEEEKPKKRIVKKKPVKKVIPKKAKAKPVEIEEDDSEEIEIEIDNDNEEEDVSVAETTESQDWFEPEGELAVDVYQTGDEIVIQSTVAGVSPDDLDISIENDIVTITGERKNPAEQEDKQYYTQECYWGSFSRQIILPEEVDTSRAEASIKDGIFMLRIPKVERQKVRKVRVRG